MIPELPWKAIGAAIGVGLLVLLFWWLQTRVRISYIAEKERDDAIAGHEIYKARVVRQARADAAQRARDQAADQVLTKKLDALNTENEKLRSALNRLAMIVETTDAHGNRRLSINADAWLCISTAVSRDPADIAACEARAGAAGMPASVSH